MPTNVLNSLAKEAGISLAQAEILWNKAKELAKEQGISLEDEDRYYAYVIGIIKNMLNLESIDLLKIWGVNIITEAIISNSSASFIKARGRKIADELKNIGNKDKEPNWGSIALNLRLFIDEFASSLSANTGLKRLLLGEAINPIRIKKEIKIAKDDTTVVDIYSKFFDDIDRKTIIEILKRGLGE